VRTDGATLSALFLLQALASFGFTDRLEFPPPWHRGAQAEASRQLFAQSARAAPVDGAAVAIIEFAPE
jgi:hypothetical protein